MDPAVIAARAARGRIAESEHGTVDPTIIERGAPTYFRTYDQVKAAMYALQAKYPGLVTVKDIGDSWEKTQGKADRDILAIELTNSKATGTKTAIEEVAGLHAREIANPELLMTWAQNLLSGYGTDAEATSLLDNHTICLVPMVNPDGHAVIERAYAGAPGGDIMHRKNTSGRGGEGVDLNRNFEFHWGGPGASSDPGSDIYRGTKAGSEPETQAVEAYTKALHPAEFTDWHSYSRLDMYPWGDTKNHAPDYAGLKAVAEKMASFNHYSPMQSIDLYPTSGTSDDDAYGALGIPSWAVETGDSFQQSDSEFQATLKENLPALDYLARIADKPLSLVNGPDAQSVTVDPTTHQLTALISSDTSGKHAIAGAELVTDPHAAPGSGIALTAADGKFDSPDEHVTGTVQLPAGATGAGELVYVRAHDAQGNWGPLTPQWIAPPAAAAATQAPA
jgi:hypothetical protein